MKHIGALAETLANNVFSVDLEDWYQGLEIDSRHWADYAPRIRAGLDPLLDI